MTGILTIAGLVATPGDLGFLDLARLPGQIPDISALISSRQGGGVRFSALLAAVGVLPGAAYLTLQAENGSFSASIPIQPALDQGLVVYRKCDGALPANEGGPVRFFIVDVEACGVAEVDRYANVKNLGRIYVGKMAGPDSRPTTQTAHGELHRRSMRQLQ